MENLLSLLYYGSGCDGLFLCGSFGSLSRRNGCAGFFNNNICALSLRCLDLLGLDNLSSRGVDYNLTLRLGSRSRCFCFFYYGSDLGSLGAVNDFRSVFVKLNRHKLCVSRIYYGSSFYYGLCNRSNGSRLFCLSRDLKSGVGMLNNNVRLAFALSFDLLGFLGNFGQNVTFSYGFNGFCVFFYSFLCNSFFRNFCFGCRLCYGSSSFNYRLCYCLFGRSGLFTRLGDYDSVAVLSVLGLLAANVIGGESCELGSSLCDGLNCRSFLNCRSRLNSCLFIRLGSFNGYVVSAFLHIGFGNVNLAGLGGDGSSLYLCGRLCHCFGYGLCYGSSSFNYRLCYVSDLSYFLGNCVCALCLLGLENSALDNLDLIGLNNLACRLGGILSDDEV